MSKYNYSLEQDFVEGCKNLRERGEDSAEILNWYRNLYHTESANTERGIAANALNDVLVEYAKMRELQSKYKKEIERLDEQLGAAYAMIGKLVGE